MTWSGTFRKKPSTAKLVPWRRDDSAFYSSPALSTLILANHLRLRTMLPLSEEIGRHIALPTFLGETGLGFYQILPTVRGDSLFDEALYHKDPEESELLHDFPHFQARVFLGASLLAGVSLLHGGGWLHGDLSWNNVFITGGGVVLIDLDWSHPDGRVSQNGPLVHQPQTPLFSAPETMQGTPLNARSEVFSLGLLTATILQATWPLYYCSVREPQTLLREKQNPDGRRLHPWIPGGYRQILLRSLDPDPQARFADANEMLAAWRETVASLPLSFPF